MAAACPACGAEALNVFYDQQAVPVQNCVLMATAAEARAVGRGDIRLAACEGCSFIWNEAFDPLQVRYDNSYEESQEFSPHFRKFADALAARWVERYDLRGARVAEVGCGKGEFLARLLNLGVAQGLALDPAAAPDRFPRHLRDRVTWLAEPLAAHHSRLAPDAIVCRHTLEHVRPVAHFMRRIRAMAGRSTPVLFEVPDAGRILEEGAFWDIYYEHCSYFGRNSLSALFEREGFEVLDLWPGFEGQYLIIEAVAAGGGERREANGNPGLLPSADTFAERCADAISRWRSMVARARSGGDRLVVWGGGSKAVACLNVIDPGRVEYVVDINTFKQGKFVPGGGQLVVAPEFLQEYQPRFVVVMNPAYLGEVETMVEALGLDPEVVSL